MTSKVLVKLPTVPFSQGKKSPIELVPMTNRHEGSTNQIRQRNIYGDSVAQLEQSMKFLQEQHQTTLVALHQEVENLRQRNRDLQFQLVFSKSNASLSSSSRSASSPEDNGNGFVKSKGSPVSINSIPLQVELLEKEIKDLKKSLDEAKTNNSYLSEIIEQQKKILETTEVKSGSAVDVGVQVDGGMYRTQPGLVSRLQDAEAIVKRLRRENEEQSKEIAAMKASLANMNHHPGGSSRNRRGNHHNSRPTTSEGSQDENSYKFPPLQSQSYWHRGSKGNQNFDHNPHQEYHRNEKNRHDQSKQERKSCDDGSVLPQLRNSTNKTDSNSASYPPFYRSRGYHSGSYYSGNKKYRGNRSQRRDQEDNGHQRRDFKDQKHPRQHEFPDAADTSKDCRTSHKS